MKDKKEWYIEQFEKTGKVVSVLFLKPVNVENKNDQRRFDLLLLIILHLTRYSLNFSETGHIDSLHELVGFAQKLREIEKGRI